MRPCASNPPPSDCMGVAMRGGRFCLACQSLLNGTLAVGTHRALDYRDPMNSTVTHKVIASVVILVVAAFLAANVLPLLGLIALLAILPWV